MASTTGTRRINVG